MDWTVILTSTVISAVFTSVAGVLIKGRLDQKLEKDKQKFEREKIINLAETQKDIEFLKSEVGQLNTLKQKNLEYYHSMHQFAQSKRVEAIESIWNEYLDQRIFTSPILNFYSVLVPSEYLNVINDIEKKDVFNIKSLNDRDLPRNLDTVPLLFILETKRPFLGELLYYKFRSSIIVLMRIRLMFSDMINKKVIYMWNEDNLLLDHVQVAFSTNTINLDTIPINVSNPISLILTMNSIELELNRAIESVVSGEVGANLSLERVKKLNQGFR